VIIGNDVWIGANAFIRGGVTIGDGAIVAASSVVLRDVPAFTIVGGNPAKIIRSRFPSGITRALLDLAWWRYSYYELAQYQHVHLPTMIAQIREAVLEGRVQPYTGRKVKLLSLAELLEAS
jgi:tetrahydrodipicolinate N-succinyltransferase